MDTMDTMDAIMTFIYLMNLKKYYQKKKIEKIE